MTDTNARAALVARQEDFDPLGPVAFVPVVQHPRFKHRTVAEVWADELRASTARGSGR